MLSKTKKFKLALKSVDPTGVALQTKELSMIIHLKTAII